IIVPYFPNGPVIHSPNELGFSGKFFDRRCFTEFFYRLPVFGSDLVEAAPIEVIPNGIVNWPEVFRRHHFLQRFEGWQAWCAIFGVKTIYPAPPGRRCILEILHGIFIFIWTAVMDSAAFALHLIAYCAVEL